MKRYWPLLALAAIFLILCCCAALVATLGGYLYLSQPNPGPVTVQPPYVAPFPRPATVTPTTRPPTASPTRPSSPSPSPSPSISPTATPTSTSAAPATPTYSTEAALEAAQLPPRDLADLASRLRYGGTPIPRQVADAPPAWAIGDETTFWIADTDTHEHKEIQAVLLAQEEHVQMWVEKGVPVDLEGLRRSATRFEQEIYPTNRRFFGSEWSPGVDADPHLVVLHARNLGGVGGYFSAADEYARLANPFSNQREMFYISLDYREPGTEGYDSTLAHEFQHMIHWYQDPNEASWVNEGLSMLAQRLNGLPTGTLHHAYLRQPDLQLTTWEDEGNAPHYGASYLLMAYFLERYGEGAVRLLVATPGNGVEGFDQALAQVGGQDFHNLFADWVVANFLDDPSLRDGRYGYMSLQFPTPEAEKVQPTSVQPLEGLVHQYGVDYLQLDPDRLGTLHFRGASTARLVPTTPHSGKFAWWSNRGDNSDARLTRTFDLTSLQEATLEVWMWYDLEEDYDYGYVALSADSGHSWTLLRGHHTTTANPTGNNLGHGYNGLSGLAPGEEGPAAWVQEHFDLTPYVGQEVQVRFEVVTDDAVNHPGLLLDDLHIPQLGYFDDMESPDPAWQAEGFVRVDNVVRQNWLLQAVVVGPGGTEVQRIPVDPQGQADWIPGQLPGDTDRVVLMVSALAPLTTEAAAYRLWVEPPAAATP